MTPPNTPRQHSKVRRSILVAASLERMWQAVTDPARLSRWLGLDVDVQPRPRARGTARGPHDERRRIQVIDVQPLQRYAFEWWPVGPGGGREQGSTVTITLEQMPEGTEVSVVEQLWDRGSSQFEANAQDSDIRMLIDA